MPMRPRPSLFLAILFLASPCWASTPEKVVVVASDQDRDLARLVSDSLGASLVVTEWGKFSRGYEEKIRSYGAEKLIIIGGIYAVPRGFEALGLPSMRVGGVDRIETAKLVLEKFFKVEARTYVMPREEQVADFIKDNPGRKAVVALGNSEVSQRWGRYYSSKLGRYMRITEAKTYTRDEAPREVELIIAVGNADNNPMVKSLWARTALPDELTYFPIIYLSRVEGVDVLFILGSDQNIFFTQRSMEELDLLRISSRDAVVFIALVSLILIWLRKTESNPRYFAAISAILGIFVLQALSRLDEFALIYDSLYVYFDGALALYFNGAYDTILVGRSVPGTSYLTYFYFLLTSPNDVNAHLLTVVLALWIIAASYHIATRVLDRNSGVAAALLLVTNPFFYDRTAFFASEIPFAAFLLASMWLLSREGRRFLVGGALALAGAALIRPVGLLLYPAASLALLRARRAGDVALVTSSLALFLALTQSAVPFVQSIEAYSREALLKAEIFPPFSTMAHNAKQSAMFILLMATPVMLPGFFRRNGTRFESVSVIYASLQAASLLVWADFFARYLFPLLPLAVILTTTGVIGLRRKWISVTLLVVALAMNFFMLFSGYRYPLKM